MALASLSGWVSMAAAVNDMPGGPRVNQLNVTEGVTEIARGQHYTHSVLLWLCAVIFVAVFSVMFYSIWAHRKSKGHKPADFHESTAVEIAWTVVPFLIVVGLGVFATGQVIAQKDTSNADLTIKVTGYQWKWGYDYLKGEGEGISFLSALSTPRDQINNKVEKSDTYLMEVDNPLVVPVNKKVRIITTAADVIHSWWVPQFGVKQDAIPGLVRDTWFKADKTGTYRGNCVELCGRDHAFMPVVVEVKSAEDYRAWVGQKQQAMAALADDPNKTWELAELQERGAKVYAANCVACHQANGRGIKGTFPALDGSQVVANKEQQIAIMLSGKGTMPSWKALSDVELAAAATYVRNSWGNKAGSAIQPAEFMAARK